MGKLRSDFKVERLALETAFLSDIGTTESVLDDLLGEFKLHCRPWYRKAFEWIRVRLDRGESDPVPAETPSDESGGFLVYDDQVDDLAKPANDSPFYLGAIEATPEKKDLDPTLSPVVRVDLDDQVEDVEQAPAITDESVAAVSDLVVALADSVDDDQAEDVDPLDKLINDALAITDESVAIQVEAIAKSADAAILALDSIIEPPTVGVPTLNEREEDSDQESASRSDPRDADRRATPDDALSGDYRIEANAETIAESARSNYNANLYDPKKILARLELRLEAARGEVADLFDNQELDRDEKTKRLNDGMEQIEEFEQRIGHQKLIIAGLVPDPNERRRREANG